MARSRAEALAWLTITLTFLAACQGPGAGVLLNDVHSRLNETRVAKVVRPENTEDVVAAVLEAKRLDRSISISGARHSMGGQQFAKDSLHLDMSRMDHLVALDEERGLARVQAGATWPRLLAELEKAQKGRPRIWTFRQKQTGADQLSLGGAVSSNIHGRGLNWRPFIQDIESLTIVDASGRVRKLSRQVEPDWFRTLVGGYGLFGVITEVELRLTPRLRVRRLVETTTIERALKEAPKRIEQGCLLGDFQFCPDESSPGFLKDGIFACYQPVALSEGVTNYGRAALSPRAWRALLTLAHSDKPAAWRAYVSHYRRTHGQIYWSDFAQMSHYDPDYESRLHRSLPALPHGSLMISELYVPKHRLADFMSACASDLRAQRANVIYGTVRFIRRDTESFLAWARDDYACVVLNLRVTHTKEGIASAQRACRQVIDRALERDGSFFLTYHRWATKRQMLQAYPQFPEFLRRKRRYDPAGLFQSEWLRHWRAEFSANEP